MGVRVFWPVVACIRLAPSYTCILQVVFPSWRGYYLQLFLRSHISLTISSVGVWKKGVASIAGCVARRLIGAF